MTTMPNSAKPSTNTEPATNAPAPTAWQPGPATQRWIQRAAKVMSSRQSNVRALAEPSIFVESGKGQRVLDVDGREYLDFAIAMGPGIWGHGHREYLDAIHQQLERLVYVQSGACQSTLEVELGEKICQHVASAERVRFHLSGSEAVQMVIRLARAFTGKPLFVRFGGHYHGWLDNVLGGVVDPDPAGAPHAIVSDNDPFSTSGRAPFALQESLLIPWNDIDALDRTLARHGSEIAIVMMEVFNSNGGGCRPKPGYIEAVRETCTRHGVLLCFDEIITGFRTCIGGAQQLVGVTPDLTIFGKAIAGGMPLAAIAGRADIFNLFAQNRVVGAGTFNAFPVAMAAGLVSMRMLERDGGAIYARRDALQKRLEAGVRHAAAEAGQKLMTQGMPGNFCTHFGPSDVYWTSAEIAAECDVAKGIRFRAALREEGVILGLGNRWFVSFALTEGDVDDTIARAARALRRL
jgi:glutamate-1-semialdehyde 2,1-aminomutase